MGNIMKRDKNATPAGSKQNTVYPANQGPPMIQSQYGQRAVQPQQVPYGVQSQQVPYGYGPSQSSGQFRPRYSGPSGLPNSQNQSLYANNAFLTNITGWSPTDIEHLRQEYLMYTNPSGVIDRNGFLKLYVASLLNSTWDMVERDSEAAFRLLDINLSGVLDFNEYVMTCTRMTREGNRPPTYPSNNY
jgi:hypothetical protein